MKKICPAIFAATLFLLSASCGAAGGTQTYDGTDNKNAEQSATEDIYGYQSYWMKQHDYKTMPVCAFLAPPVKVGEYTENFVTEKHYRILAESGINTAYGLTESLPAYSSDVRNALSYCDKFNLSYVACVSSLHTMKTRSQVEYALYDPLLTGAVPALGGVIVRDEPSYSEFAGCKKAKDILTEFFPDILFHSNLFPDYATPEQLYNRATGAPALPAEGYSYERYVSDYVKAFQPQILSYDYYPMAGEEGKIADGYFKNMSVIRKQAQQAEIPFWVYIQTCSFNPSVRVPNEGEIQWLVNTSLAYGAKGIQYFTYFLPNDGGEIFKGAMVGRNGEKTPVYDYVKSANKQIAAADEILMRAFSKGVIVTGETPCEIPSGDVLSSYGALKNVSARHTLTGCFDFRGKDAFYAVNNSITEGDTVSFSLTGSGGYYILDGIRRTFDGRVDVTLEKGQGILIVTE